MSNPGMQIRESFPRPPREVVERFSTMAAANVADASNRMFAMHADIRPMGRSVRVCGPALTVKTAMADNLMFHKALSMAQPGDVIVVDCCGDRNQSVCGDVMFRYAKSRGVAGFVVNGCIRDVDFLQEDGFPVYALGATPRGPYKSAVGEINFDIVCGGQVVHPGDIILGDEDGVVVVRREDAEAILEKMPGILEKERLMGALIDSGEWEQKSPILLNANKQLESAGFEIIQ